MPLAEAFIPLILVAGLFLLLTPWLDPSNVRVRQTAFVVVLGLQVVYMWWRFSHTLPPASRLGPFIFSVGYLSIELLLTWTSLRFLRGIKRHHHRGDEADSLEGWTNELQRPPLVDILIPTYNEDWSIVEKTVVGALAQDYPRVRIWLLDDGRREVIAGEARRLGVGYLTRTDNKHAKAGNLNAGLAHILALPEPPDFIGVLDADFIPRRRFVSRAMALMKPSDVGLVQTPQNHYNPDPFQATFRVWDGWPDTQRFPFTVILPARDAAGRAYCCGTSFLVRVDALRAIGGFPTESITEDVLTSMKIGMAGWRTVYLNEILTTGLAPEGVREYLTQRGRWCLGGVQIGLWHWGLKRPGTTTWQRIMGTEGFLRWGYTSLFRFVFMLVPLLFWYTGIPPFAATSAGIICYAFPLIFLQRWYMSWLSRGTQLPIINQAQNLLASFAVAPALLKGLFQRKDHRFVVTDKGTNQAGVVVHWGTLRWMLGYAVLTVIGMIYRFVVVTPPPGAWALRGIATMWSVFNLLVILVAATPCIELPRRRQHERYRANERATIASGDGQGEVLVSELGIGGAVLTTTALALAVGDTVTVGVDAVGPVAATMVRRLPGQRVAVAFQPTDEQRRALILKIYAGDGYVRPPQHGSGWIALRALVRKYLVGAPAATAAVEGRS